MQHRVCWGSAFVLATYHSQPTPLAMNAAFSPDKKVGGPLHASTISLKVPRLPRTDGGGFHIPICQLIFGCTNNKRTLWLEGMLLLIAAEGVWWGKRHPPLGRSDLRIPTRHTKGRTKAKTKGEQMTPAGQAGEISSTQFHVSSKVWQLSNWVARPAKP